MQSLKKKIKLNMFVGIAVSVMFLVCVPPLIFVIFNIDRSLLSWVFAVVCVVAGVYGLPFVWLNVFKLVKMKKAFSLIANGATDYLSIAAGMKVRVRTAKRYVNRLFKFGYISSVDIDEEPIYSEPVKFKAKSIKCKGCGGTYVKDSNEMECPYCGKYN
jgi:hypothetical protein